MIQYSFTRTILPQLTWTRILPEFPVFLVQQPNAGLYQSCNGIYIEDPDGTDGLMIDCVFERRYLKTFIEQVSKKVQCHVTTHFHVDHSAKVYRYERAGIPVHAPRDEAPYLMSRDHFMESAGLRDARLDDIFTAGVMDFFDFKYCSDVQAIQENQSWEVGNLRITMINSPGHSAGHPCFEITNLAGEDQGGIFHCTDLGFDRFGPWFGFPNCNLHDYFSSILKAKERSRRKSAIVSSHIEPIINDPDRVEREYDKLMTRIEYWIEKTLQLVKKYPAGFKSIYANKEEHVFKKSKLLPNMVKIYEYWEVWMTELSCMMLVERGRLKLKFEATEPPQYPENVYVPAGDS